MLILHDQYRAFLYSFESNYAESMYGNEHFYVLFEKKKKNN